MESKDEQLQMCVENLNLSLTTFNALVLDLVNYAKQTNDPYLTTIIQPYLETITQRIRFQK